VVRGLLWLPLLALFIGLAWAGWNEYSKLEAYKVWAQQFERAKYDIYSALGQQGDVLTWGLPTRQGIVESASLNMKDVEHLSIEVNDTAIDDSLAKGDDLPTKGRFSLGFTLKDGRHQRIPFTEGAMAVQWSEFLRKEWQL